MPTQVIKISFYQIITVHQYNIERFSEEIATTEFQSDSLLVSCNSK